MVPNKKRLSLTKATSVAKAWLNPVEEQSARSKSKNKAVWTDVYKRRLPPSYDPKCCARRRKEWFETHWSNCEQTHCLRKCIFPWSALLPVMIGNLWSWKTLLPSQCVWGSGKVKSGRDVELWRVPVSNVWLLQMQMMVRLQSDTSSGKHELPIMIMACHTGWRM